MFPELLLKKRSEVEVCLVVGISAIRDLTISGSVVLIPSDVNPTVAADISSSVVKESVARGTIVSVSVLKLLMVCSNGDSVVSVFVDCSVSNVSSVVFKISVTVSQSVVQLRLWFRLP